MAEKNLLSTFGDFLVEIGRGISNTTEGIIDAHIAPVAWVGGFFDKDFKKRASETIAYNWTDDHIKKWGWDKVREKSYASTWRGGGETARGIAEGVGAMLPSLALSAIPYAGPALSQASMSMGAGGKNMEQAINEGANFDNAFLYGIVSGSLEAGIERLGGHVMGGGSSIIGKKLAGTSLGKFTSKGVGKMLEVGVSEAGEELISAYSDPLVKAGTGVDTDIAGNYAEAVQNTGKTIATGAGVGMIIHGGQTTVRNISNTTKHRGGARATRADNFLTSFTELGENYSTDEKQNAKTLKAQNEYLRSMSQEIQGMDKTSRENYLKSSPLKQVFNAEDGTLKLDLVRENTNNEAVSSSIKAYSGTFEHAPITNEEVIGEGARATKGYIEQILGKKARVIITSEYSDNTNASFSISEGIFYVNNNATELSKEQVAKQVAIHEIVHYTEGTEQYYEMVDELAKVVEDSNAPVEVKKRIGDLSKRLEAIKKDYQGDTEGMNEALKQYVYQTEGVAELVGDLLAQEQYITRLAQRNESFVKKLLTKIKALANKSAKVDSEATKYLNKLVKSFEKAIDNAHGGVSLNSIGNADEEREEKSDSSQQSADSKVDDERKSYAGIKARTANGMTLQNAKKMLEQGIDAETIRKETGWFMGYDKKWRFEIDDSQMKVNSDTSNYTTLDKLIEHEALFSAYPELRQLRITFSDLRESRGSYDRRFGDISIDYSLKGDAENLKMLLIHEIQHAIQDIESFARGASPEFWENKIAQGFDTRTDYVKQQETELLEKIKKKRHENRDFIEDIEFLVDSTPNKPRGKVDWETLEQIEEDPPEWRSFDRRREQLAKEYGEEEVFEYMEAISNLERLRHTMDRYDAYTLYMFTAGEIEARDTASRLELDAEQRKNNRPNIDEEVVVFAEDSTVSKDFIGWNANGNEVYQTSQNTQVMSHSQRIADFKQNFLNNFRGKTAKFERNGHTYYAQFVYSKKGIGKFTHEGNSKSDKKGYKAKVRLLADGDIINVVEDAKYQNSAPEIGKNISSHANAIYWDYLYKTIVVDGKGYDIVIDIRNDAPNGDYSKKEQFVYSIEFYENKNVATSVTSPANSKFSVNLDIATDNSITENGENVNSDERKSVQRSYNPSNEVDSEGSSLSEAQAEFFKDSKVRDKNGNLLVVYHGSQAQFTEFKHKYINLHGSQEGRGFYFTDKKSMAQGYEREGGQLLKGYLNITKPLSDTEFTLTRAEIKKLLKALDPTGDDIVINYDTEGGMGYPSQAWYNRAFNDALNAIMNYCDTDSEVLAEIRNSGADEETLLNTVREVLGYDGYMVSDKYEGASVFVAFESNQFKNADNKAPTFNPDIRYSKKRSYTPGEDANNKKITLGMSDAERTEILKNKSIKLSAETNSEKIEQAQEKHEFTEESFNLANFADKRGLVIKVGDEFGVFKNYHNEDIELSFQYSKNNAREGMDKQKKQYYDFVKMLSCFDLVIENAVGIEMHNRNSEGYKKDITLKNMYVLASAFVDGNEVVPVKLEIKEFTDKPSSLYVAIALERIDIETIKKDGVVVQEVADNSVAQQVTRPSSISIAEYFKNINPKDESFYKYIPKLFLNDGVDLNERYSKKRSYTPTEDADFEDEGNVWVEDEEDGVKVILSTPDFNNPNYEKNHAPGYRLSDTYDGNNPEAYVIEGKQNILSENSALKKFVADNIKLKKYSRKDAASILFEIMNEKGYFDKINTKFKGKSKAEIERMLWDALNIKVGGQRGGAALDIADAIITNLLVTEQYEMTPELELAYQVVNYLKIHLHNVNLDHIKGDIKVKYDKNNSPYALWARKEGTRGVTADQIKEELEVEIPGIRISATTEADIFLEIDELYRNAREIIKESTPEKTTLLGVMDSNEVKALRQSIARDILKAYDKYGAETTFSKLEKKYLDRLNKLSHKLYDEQRMGKLERIVLKEIRKIVDNKNGKYANATQVQTDALKNIKTLLGKINSREQINRTSTRDIMKAFSEWYKKDNPVLEGFYLEEMAELVDYFSTSQGKAKLTYSELDIIRIVLRHMNFVFENYGKIFRLGKYVEAKDVAKDHLKVMKEALDSQSTIEKLLFKNKATRFFMDPTAVAAQYDGHDENGFFTQTLKEFQEGLIMQRYYEMVALEEFKEFTEKKHKKYFKELLKGKRKINVGAEINIRGLEVKTVEVPVYYAMELYMVSKTGEAIQTLEETGWMLKLDDSKEQKQMGKLSKEQIEAIYNQFTADDKQLITIMEKAYNGICRELKLETDMKRLGFSNVFDGYYYPIHRFTATEFDSNDFFVEMERVSKVGFNNNRVKGAKQALLIGNVFSTFIRHVNAVTRYSALSIPISNMKMVYNMDVGENANMPESIKMWVLTNKMWDGAQDYFQKLADDVQQIGVKPDEGSKVFAYLRGAYAKSALGANPKVWFSQLSSYLAAFGELHFTSLARASTIKGFIKDSDVDKYCKLAAVRHYERGATRAMTVTDQIGKVGEILTAPIEMVDRQVVKMLFAACQAEAKSRYKLDIGTEENKIKAGELLKDVILRSQQNQLITEQSKAMRSTSELTRSLTMFNADSMKLLSRFIEYVGKTATLSKKMKQAQSDGNETLYIELSSQHKTAVKHLCKYSAAIVSIAVYMSLIAKLFKWLYNKDDKEENTWNNFGKDVVGNIIGMVPIVRDIYSYFEDGYDVDNYAFSMINDLLKAVNNTKNAFVQLASGKEVSSQKWSSSIRSLVYSLSQFLGIPTRNIYNFTTGLIRRVDEGTGLKIDSVFYAPSSTTLKEKYLEGKEKGKNSLVGASLDLMYQNRDIEITDAVLKREMDRLINKNLTKERDDNTNYSPFGSKIPDTITFNGEEIELTSKQTNGFKTAYKSAEAYSAKTVKTAMYKGLDDESKAYAIRKVYEYYHQSALEDITGERAKLVYFGSFIGIDKLALIIAYAKNVKGDSSGTRKEKIELYIKKFGLTKSQASLALRYLGYTDKAMDSQVQNLIKARGSLTKEQKEEFLGYI